MAIGTFQGAGQDYRDASSAIQAKVDEVNAAGGVKGRQLQLTVCDDQANPNQATTCARKAISSKVVAVLAPTSANGFGTQVLPVLQAGGIPMVGNPAVSPADWTSPNAFPLDPGEGAQYDGVGIALKQAGCTRVGTVQLPVASGAEAVTLLREGLSAIGSQLVLNVKTGMSETTYAPQVAQLISAGAQCIIPVIAPTEAVKLITAAGQSGKKLIIAGVTAAFGQQILSSLGSNADGIILAGAEYLPTDTTVPGVADMIAAMKKYTPNIQASTRYATSAWGSSTLLLNDVLPAITGDITAASITKGLEATTNAPTGTYDPYTFAKPAPNGTFPRLRNTGILTWKVGKNSIPELTSKGFVDVYQAMNAAH